MIPLQLLIFVIGLVILYFGAEWLVKGAAGLAIRYGIRPMVVGITVVALATSMPEFVVNFLAALDGEDSLALGNVVGSNIANIGLILGISALVLPLAVSSTTLRNEYPMMMGVALLFYLLSLDGTISRIDGGILITGLAAFFIYVIRDTRKHAALVTRAVEGEEDELAGSGDPIWKQALYIAAGVAALAGGAQLMVKAAVTIAEFLGISPIVIGLTVVAIGTSLPELAASIASALKKDADMSVGNVLGSNLLNILFVIGMVSLIRPLHVDTESLHIHFPVMLGFSLLLLPLAWTRFQISRLEGALLLAGFAGYIVYLVLPYVG
ncbi:MAG: calcium/sodium antiporter [Rhodothermales bacterium]